MGQSSRLARAFQHRLHSIHWRIVGHLFRKPGRAQRTEEGGGHTRESAMAQVVAHSGMAPDDACLSFECAGERTHCTKV